MTAGPWSEDPLGVVFGKHRKLGERESKRPRGVDVLIKRTDIADTQMDHIAVGHFNINSAFDDVDNFGPGKWVGRYLWHGVLSPTPELGLALANPRELTG